MSDDSPRLEPDPVLGRWLRSALDDPAGLDAFVSAARGRCRTSRRPVREALAAWSRWGVAAAAAAVVVTLVYSTRPGPDATATLDEALTSAGDDAMNTLLTNETSPGAEVIYSEGEAE